MWRSYSDPTLHSFGHMTCVHIVGSVCASVPRVPSRIWPRAAVWRLRVLRIRGGLVMEGAEALGWCSTSSGLMEVGLMTGGAGGAVGLCVWGKNYIFINRLKTTPPRNRYIEYSSDDSPWGQLWSSWSEWDLEVSGWRFHLSAERWTGFSP